MPYIGPRSAGLGAGATDLPAVVDSLMTAETLLPVQLPTGAANWTPEKRLAGAVLGSALNEVRLYHHRPSYRRQVQETLDWIRSEDGDWPFSFLSLCALFALDPDWVREEVADWLGHQSELERRRPTYRRAA